MADVKLNLEGLLRELAELRQVTSSNSVRQFTEYARAAQQAEGMLRQVAWLRLELDNRPDGNQEVLITWQDIDGHFRTARGDGLPDALQSAEPAADGKVCNGPCGSWRPLTAYSRNTDRPDGHCQRCKKCEKLRMRRRRRERRAG